MPASPRSWAAELIAYTGFSDEDAALLRAVHGAIDGAFPAIVDEFYDRILATEGARRVLTDGPGQVARLKASLLEWLRTLFAGPHDGAYWERRSRIAHTHVRVELPIPYVVGAMDLIRIRLTQALRRATEREPARLAATMAALHRLIDIELAVLLEGYEALRLAAARERHRTEVNALGDAALRVAGDGSSGPFLEGALADLCSSLGADAGGVYVLRDQALRLAALRGPAGALQTEVRLRDPAWPLLEREGIHSGEDDGVRRLLRASEGEPALRTVASMPIRREDRWIGTLVVASAASDRFRPDALPFLRAMAASVGVGIEHLLLYERLRISEAHFRAIVENASESIFTVDRGGRATYLNRGLLGYSQREILERGLAGIRGLVAEESRAAFDAALAAAFDESKTAAGLRLRMRVAEGEEFIFHGSLVPLLSGAAEAREVLGVFRDVTAEEQMRDDLLHSERLATIGQVAASIAHEVRNPLAGAKGVLEILGERFPAGSEERGIIGQTIDRFDTLSRLISDLLVFARPMEAHLRRVEASAVLREIADGLRREETLRGVTIAEVADADLGRIEIDDGLLWMAFLNLARNAAEAMGGKGEITVRGIRTRDGEVELRVEDRGPGFSASVRGRLFTPFVSTKRGGTGLGLAMVKRVAEAHQGRVAAEDRPGGGASFAFVLPLRRK